MFFDGNDLDLHLTYWYLRFFRQCLKCCDLRDVFICRSLLRGLLRQTERTV